MKYLREFYKLNESLQEFGGSIGSTSIAGFTLCAYKIDSGSYQLGSKKGEGKIIDNFPEEIECYGTTYTLEHVEDFVTGFVNAHYC